VLEQRFVDAALKAGSTADIRLAVERVAGRRAIAPERYIAFLTDGPTIESAT
jgi:hypothetical protein